MLLVISNINWGLKNNIKLTIIFIITFPNVKVVYGNIMEELLHNHMGVVGHIIFMNWQICDVTFCRLEIDERWLINHFHTTF
jgi:hypothetical protein